MKQYLILIVLLGTLISCAEELIKKPEQLISEDKMVDILKEMALVNAAKGTNVEKLEENGIDPTAFIFEKYEIDSTQFVDNDRYYASLPLVYERIYKKVDSKLELLEKELQDQKKINDSLNLLNKKATKGTPTEIKDTLTNGKPPK